MTSPNPCQHDRPRGCQRSSPYTWITERMVLRAVADSQSSRGPSAFTSGAHSTRLPSMTRAISGREPLAIASLCRGDEGSVDLGLNPREPANHLILSRAGFFLERDVSVVAQGPI